MESINYNEWCIKMKSDLRDIIVKNNYKLWCPPIKEYDSINVNSCYDMKVINNPNIKESELEFNKIPFKIPDKITKCKRIFLKLSKRQKKIIDFWLDACTEMYNVTVKHVKSILNFDKIKELRQLYILINKKNGSLVIKISDLKKNIEKLLKTKKTLLKYVTSDKKKNKYDIKTFNKKLEEYVDIKNKIKLLNEKLFLLESQLLKSNKKYNDIYNNIKNKLDYEYLRTYKLKDIRDNISKKYIFDNENKTAIKVHMIDCSIKMACASFKTGLTNYLEGNSGMFKIKYWSNDRPKKVMEIEPGFINKEGFICKTTLGEMLMYECKSNKWIEYKLEKNKKSKSIKLHYDSKTDTYSLFVPKDEKPVKSSADKNSFASLDAGIRTFMSCITNDQAIQFGTKMYRKISNLLLDIDIINNDIFLSKRKKRKLIMKIYNRINNIVDEMHWKIINYLTNTYERIYIGILNMKDVVNNETSVIGNMSKRVGLMMKHFQFRQRLIFKCKSKRIQCIEVNERYTSKTCSVCGGYKKDLGSNKTYDCDSCNNLMDRDMNASRCILLKNTK